jgi:hypothetical protein
MPGFADWELKLEPKQIPKTLNITLQPSEKVADKPAITGGAIYGGVLDPSGNPSLVFTIYLLSLDGQDLNSKPRRFISIDGNFEINNLPEGNYSIFARRQDDRLPDLRENPYQIEVHKGKVQDPILLRLVEPAIK